jgi:Flp pilus assembly protein TadD
MRVLSIVFLALLTISAAAQTTTSLVRQSFEKGTRLARAGEYETALESYRQSLFFAETQQLDTGFLAKIHYNIGVCLYQLKDNRAAVREFNEAVKLSRGEYQKAFYALGMAHAEMKNHRAAENAFLDALKLEKSDAEAWFDLAMVYLESENYDAASQAFQNAVKFCSANRADALNNIGVILALRGDFRAAETEFQLALKESAGNSIEARDNLLFCKAYRRNQNSNLRAKLVFSSR